LIERDKIAIMKRKSIYKVLNTSTLTIQRFFKKVLKPYGVTPKQLIILDGLWTSNCTTPKQLQNLTGLDSASITGVVNRLVKSDFIYTKVNPNDKRSIKINLTIKGATFQKTGIEILNKLDSKLQTRITQDEIDIFYRVLSEIDYQASS